MKIRKDKEKSKLKQNPGISEDGGMCLAESGKTSTMNPAEVQVLSPPVKAIVNKIKESVLNSFNQKIPVFSTPAEILQLVRDLENSYAQDLDQDQNAFRATSSAKSTARNFHQDPAIQEFYLNALQLLYKGRGKTGTDQPGCYPANKNGPTGLKEFEVLLNQGVLSQKNLEMLKDFVENYDFDDPQIKMNQGFPSHFIINSQDIKNRVLKMIESAIEAASGAQAPKASHFQTPVVSARVSSVLGHTHFHFSYRHFTPSRNFMRMVEQMGLRDPLP